MTLRRPCGAMSTRVFATSAKAQYTGFRGTIKSVAPPLFAADKAMSDLLIKPNASAFEGFDAKCLAEMPEVTDVLDLPRLGELELRYLGTEGLAPVATSA
jgi:hypothetical protein